ncbi:YybH family protein [Salinispira pacifica]
MKQVLALLITLAVGTVCCGVISCRTAPEGVRLPPNAPMAVGKEAIEKQVRGVMVPDRLTEMTISPQDVKTTGVLVVARGLYTMKMTPAFGGGTFDGKFLTVFRKQSDGSWKIYRDCFDSNTPPGK